MNCVSCLLPTFELVEQSATFQALTSNVVARIEGIVVEKLAAHSSNVALLVADLAKNSASLGDPPV